MNKETPETLRAVNVPAEKRETGSVDLTLDLRLPDSSATLRPIQSLALDTIRRVQGGFFPIGVGHGKTLISLLAGTVLDSTMAVILTKAAVCSQMEADQRTWAPHFRMPTNVRVMSYPTLSRPENTDTLTRLADLHRGRLVLVADECQELRRFEAARTKRVARILEANPDIRFVALTGTITSKSVKDYAHLAEWALRHNSPVPRTAEEGWQQELDSWARCIDPEGRASQSDWTLIWPLFEKWGAPVACNDCGGGGRKFGTHCPRCGGSGDARAMQYGEARQAYAQLALHNRLVHTPGVVATSEASVDIPIEFEVRKPELPDQVRAWLQLVDATGENPDGEILPDDLQKANAKRNLSWGFYQRWEWPIGPDGQPMIDEEWLRARRLWNKHVNDELKFRAADGYDSPMLVWAAIHRQVKAIDAGEPIDFEPSSIHAAWRRWEPQRPKKPPPSVPEWYSDFIIDEIEKLLADLKGAPAIIWYESKAIEVVLRHVLKLRCYGAGSEPPSVRPGETPETVACSYKSHGTGRNLQAWAVMVLVQPPADAALIEQIIGRIHRYGQEADRIKVIAFGQGSYGKAIKTARDNRAGYIERTSGNAQKLRLARWTGNADCEDDAEMAA